MRQGKVPEYLKKAIARVCNSGFRIKYYLLVSNMCRQMTTHIER